MHGCPQHITYLEAGVVGLIQGVTELFPVSSLGHNVLLPALVGGCWAHDLNVAAPESPYLAFIVGLHVATAIALLIYFWKDWIRIIGGFFSSLGHFARPEPGTSRWQLRSVNEKLAWMIILATIPVGLVGLKFEHEFRVFFGKPIRAAIFLAINGVILIAGEVFRRKASVQADQEVAAEREREREKAAVGAPAADRRRPARGGPPGGPVRGAGGRDRGRPAAGPVWLLAGDHHRQLADPRAAGGHQPRRGSDGSGHVPRAVPRGRGQVRLPARHAGHPGRRGTEDPGPAAGRWATASTGQVVFGSVLSGVGAYVSVRFLMRYFQTRTLTPFGIYCLVVGLGSIVYLGVIK